MEPSRLVTIIWNLKRRKAFDVSNFQIQCLFRDSVSASREPVARHFVPIAVEMHVLFFIYTLGTGLLEGEGLDLDCGLRHARFISMFSFTINEMYSYQTKKE